MGWTATHSLATLGQAHGGAELAMDHTACQWRGPGYLVDGLLVLLLLLTGGLVVGDLLGGANAGQSD